MKFRYLTVVCFIQAVLLQAYPGVSFAEDWFNRIRFSGFASSIYRVTDEAEPFNGDLVKSGIDENGSFQGTRIALNFNAAATERVALASQLVSSKGADNYSVRIDWGFIGIVLNDEFTIRAGKIKYPVGLINEYIDVGYTYPWISPPPLFYTEELAGPQVTREAFTGASLNFNRYPGDWAFEVIAFGGEVSLSNIMRIRELMGLTVSATWDDSITVMASTYVGEMESTIMAAMDGRDHQASTVGLNIDWNNIIFYGEYGNVDMDDFLTGKAETWYTSLGYRIGDFTPHITYQSLEKAKSTASPQDQDITTVGLRYELTYNTALKVEYSRISTAQGIGLFDNSAPLDDSVNMFGAAIDIVF